MGCALTGLEKVDVWVGVVGNDGVALFEHAASRDAVEVEGNHDRNVGAENATSFCQKMALGIEFGFCGHGAVHAEVDGIDGRRVANGVEKLGCDAVPVWVCEGAAGGDEERAVGGNEGDVWCCVKDRESASDFVADGSVIVEEGLSASDSEIVVSA